MGEWIEGWVDGLMGGYLWVLSIEVQICFDYL